MYNSYESPSADLPFIYNKPQIKRQFIDKTLQTVALQLCVTAVLTIGARNVTALHYLSSTLAPLWHVAFIGIVLTLSCVRSVAQTVPTNYFLLGALTVVQSFLLHNYSWALRSDLLIEASIITAVLITLAYFFASTTNFDFTAPKFLLWFNLAHLAIIFVSWIFIGSDSILFAYISALCILVYIITDIHMIMGDKNYKLTIDDHVYASMILYIDVVTLFMKILAILNDNDKKKRRNN